jgi:hypothetical protein
LKPGAFVPCMQVSKDQFQTWMATALSDQEKMGN